MPDTLPDTTLRHFTPAWFSRLLTARLGLGDTFWIGNFGVALFLVPVTTVCAILLDALGVGEVALGRFLGVYFILMTLYFIALLRAVFLCARRTPEVGGWRWVGVVYTAMNALFCAVFAVLFLISQLT